MPLPETVAMNPGVQIITSTEREGMFEAVVRVCSERLTRDELIDLASDIAAAVKADPASASLAELVVTGWSPAGDTIDRDESVRTEYSMFTWDPTTSSVPLSKNWD